MTHQARTAKPAPFRIHVDQRELDDLRMRLGNARWTRPLADDWGSGTKRSYLRELIAYWRDGYDWRRHEARLNQLDQFKARVGDANLHFVHVRGSGRGHGYRPLPLLLLHGWPEFWYACASHTSAWMSWSLIATARSSLGIAPSQSRSSSR